MHYYSHLGAKDLRFEEKIRKTVLSFIVKELYQFCYSLYSVNWTIKCCIKSVKQMLISVGISVMNTKGADDDIENSDDEDDSNSDIVEDRGGIVVFRVVDVQTGQHQKQYPCQDLKDKKL